MEMQPPASTLREKVRNKILQRLLEFNDWSDEIPEAILHGGGKFKVRINWWSGVCGNLQNALSFELIKDPETRKVCEEFTKKYLAPHYWGTDNDKRTTREEIEEANRVIQRVIIYLQE